MLSYPNYIQKVKKARSKRAGPKPDPTHVDYTIYNDNSPVKNILSNIDYRIKIEHHQDPLIYCYHIPIQKGKNIWQCIKCNNDYNINIPSFLCTKCPYNLCQKCFLGYKVKEISQFSYLECTKECTHHQMMIQFTKNIGFPCYKCKNTQYDSCSYCSLCNYIVCKNCFSG